MFDSDQGKFLGLKNAQPRHLRRINKKIILNLIRDRKCISQPELSSLTNLRMPSVVAAVNALREDGLIISAGKDNRPRQGGPQPTLWRIRTDVYVVGGVNLEVGTAEVVLVDLSYKILTRKKFPLPGKGKADHLLRSITNALRKLLNQLPHKNVCLLGLGMGISGLVSYEKGIVYSTSLFKEKNFPLARELSGLLSVPVVLENNSNAALFAELTLGVAKGKKNVLAFCSGKAVGIAANGSIHRGESGAAGEIAYSSEKEGELREAYTVPTLGDPEDLYRWGMTQFSGLPKPVLRQIAAMVSSGNKEAEELLKKYTLKLGQDLAPLVALFNFGQILIYGEDFGMAKLIIPLLRRTVKKLLKYEAQWKPLKISWGVLGGETTILGAAALIIERIFDAADLKLPRMTDLRSEAKGNNSMLTRNKKEVVYS